MPGAAWGDRRIREISEMTGLPVSPGGLCGKSKKRERDVFSGGGKRMTGARTI